jgi:flavin reductase (DIM6/NTAB) family NADH-FMN oxidoreductase RutF
VTDELKQVLSHWASGVAIVTSRAGERVHGMTVSAFSSVSLDPPLVLVCADKTSKTHPVIAAGRVFAVNILSRDQVGLSERFAAKKDEDRRFEGVPWESGKTGAPLLPGSLAILECRVVAAHEAGTHVIYVGRVEDLRPPGGGEPLVYYARAYRGLARPAGE